MDEHAEIRKMKEEALKRVKEDYNLKTACDAVLSQNWKNIFEYFKSEEEAKKIIRNTLNSKSENNNLSGKDVNIIYKVFKLLQYYTIISEQIYIIGRQIELYKKKSNTNNEHIYDPLIQVLHEGMVNRIMKIYDSTKIKQEKSFSLTNIQRDFKTKETVNEKQKEIRNTLLAHLSLEHTKINQESIRDYDKLYANVRKDITMLLDNIAPNTAKCFKKIMLLNDVKTKGVIARGYSNKNYHKLVTHEVEELEVYCVYQNN